MLAGELVLVSTTFTIYTEKLLTPGIFLFALCVEPNDESGANIDASKMYRENRPNFERIVRECVKKSLGL